MGNAEMDCDGVLGARVEVGEVEYCEEGARVVFFVEGVVRGFRSIPEDVGLVEVEVEAVLDGEELAVVAFTGTTVTVIMDLIVDFNVVVLAGTVLWDEVA